jgi:hypothetical protein
MVLKIVHGYSIPIPHSKSSTPVVIECTSQMDSGKTLL